MGTITFSSTVRGMTAAEFAKWETELLPAFSPYLDSLADWYKAKTAQTFSDTHGGLTGETELSPQVIPAVPNPVQIQSTVRYGGHVAFVVDPIKSHEIATNTANVLANAQVNIRASNQFSPFGPVRGPVGWYQGGPESHAPDKSWFQRWQAPLEVTAVVALRQFGAVMAATLAAQGFGMEHDVAGPDYGNALIPML